MGDRLAAIDMDRQVLGRLLWPNGCWMDQDATWYGDRSR